MNHEELLAKINDVGHSVEYGHGIETSRIVKQLSALRAVVELHSPFDNLAGEFCTICTAMEDKDIYTLYPCPTIQAIEKELQ